MMPQSIGRKYNIFFYIFIFIFLSTINNISWNNKLDSILKIKKVEVTGLDNELNQKIKKKFDYLIGKNIFYISQNHIKKILNNINYIENYKVSKFFPSKVKVDLYRTKILAATYKNNKKIYIGSNKKFIDFNGKKLERNYPIIFGNFPIDEFFNLINFIEKSNFDIEEIKEYYYFPSKRWDVKLNNEVIAKLPNENISNSIDLLSKIVKENISKDNKVIDLRVPNQIIFSNE